MPNISYAITVCNEAEELKRLLDLLLEKLDDNDEIVVLHDSSNTTERVIDICREYENQFAKGMFVAIEHELNNDFAAHKNYLNSQCSKEYIFQIDADEYPSHALLNNLKHFLSSNSDSDLFLVPRINTVEGITKEHIEKWNWRINKYGWINFPDYQSRIYKNEKQIKWKGKVHEQISGFSTYSVLPGKAEYSLYHKKVIEKQIKQNEMYDKIIR
jgi:glycosyltransferase involved in cell wall biosynthesis